MKKLCVLGVLAGMVVAPSLWADQVFTTGTWGPYQTGSGGEFTLGVDTSLSAGGPEAVNNDLQYYVPGTTMNVTTDPVHPNFQTFCVEGSEYIYQNTTYAYTIQQHSMYNGLGQGNNNGVNLTVGAAALYYEFARGILGTGSLPSYNYTGARTTSAGLLQNAIWWLMGQEGQGYTPLNPYEQYINNTFGSTAFADNNGLIPVAVLSLWVPGEVDTTAGAEQDQLILTGKLTGDLLPVPDGGLTVGLLGLALSGLGFFSRKHRA